MVDYFVTPSILNSFVQDERWGYEAYLKTLYPPEHPEFNFFTLNGHRIHEKYGYNNTLRFFKVICVNGYEVAIEGTPDKLNPLTEVKTTTKISERKIQAAEIQLQAYMYLTGYDYGEVIFYDQQTEKVIYRCEYSYSRAKLEYWIMRFVDYVRRKERGLQLSLV